MHLLLPNTPVITDDNWKEYARPVDETGTSSTGYMHKPEDFEAACASAFPSELLIPESDWPAMYEEMVAKKRLLSYIAADAVRTRRARWLNQHPTNYCWCYAVVHAMMVLKLWQNDPWQQLVPESVACLVKNFRNIGGWGSQALDYIVEHGVANEDHWPRPSAMDAIKNGRAYVESSRANAATNKVTAWWRITNFQEKMSCLLRMIPVPSGYLRIGHEMCSIDPYRDKSGRWGCVDLDSYASKSGMFNTSLLIGQQMIGEDMVAPAVTT